MEYAEGEGRGNLYDNGQPHAIDFRFRCPVQFRTSVGYETYMARWKKPHQELEMLLPEIGKPGSTSVCRLTVDLRETQAYVALAKGETAVVPAAAYKQWMDKVQYDPEHGKDTPLAPLRLSPNGAQRAPATALSQPPASTSPH